MYAVPDCGKTSKVYEPLVMLSEFGTILCSEVEVYDLVLEGLLNNHHSDISARPAVILLGSFHKRGSVEIKVALTFIQII